MQRSTVTGRPMVANRIPWQFQFRMALLLLFETWHLTEAELVGIYHGLFPVTRDYLFPKLRDQYNQRWSGGRRERDWRILDRPNRLNGTAYTNQELLNFATGVADIVRVANNLNIQLTLKVAPTHQLLRHVPAGTAGMPHIQSQVAPAPSAPTALVQAPMTVQMPPPVQPLVPSQLPVPATAGPTGAAPPSTTAQATPQSVMTPFVPIMQMLPMVHGRDVTFYHAGPSYYPHPDTVFGGQNATVDTSSALYAMGGALHLVEDAPGIREPGEDNISTVAAVTICNKRICGICKEDAADVDDPITDKPEDRLIYASSAGITDLRGRPLVHRRDLAGRNENGSLIFDPRCFSDAATGYSYVAMADWDDEYAEMAGFEEFQLRLPVRVCRDCPLCWDAAGL